MSILDTLGISEEQYEKAKDSTVTEAFEVAPSGVYDGKVKEVIIYKNKFGGETLKINFTFKYNDQERTISYRDDIGKNLKQTDEEKKENKPGKINEGFVQRLKSLCTATNVDLADVKEGATTEVNSYGAKCEGKFYLGFNDKKVKLLVRHSQDSNKAEGEAYRDSNDVEGVTSANHEDIEKFSAKVEKQADGIFKYKGYVKDGAKKDSAAQEEVKEKAKNLDF